jgi:hypothetical protein
MPYTNVPESLWGKMDDCKKKVMDEQGYSEERAIAICHASIVEGKELKKVTPGKSIKERIIAFVQDVFATPEQAGSGFDAGSVGAVFKQADGRYRWITFSSNAFEDGDREIVSTKALADDVAHSDASGDYGPLLYWHMPQAELGACDYRALHDRMLIESGVFHLEAVGRAIKEAAPRLKTSLGFYHPLTEPDGDKVFHTVRTFERSLLPADKAANQLTALTVTRKESSMDDKKLAALKDLLGDDLAAQVVKQADTQQKAAQDAGVRFKAGDTPEDKKPDEEIPPAAEEEKQEGLPDDSPVTVGMLKAVIEQLRADYDAKLAEAGAPMAEEAKERKAKTDDLAARMTVAEKELKRLLGDLPKAIKQGFRASEAGPTPDEAKTKELQPAANPLDPIMGLLTGKPANPFTGQ